MAVVCAGWVCGSMGMIETENIEVVEEVGCKSGVKM